MKGFRERVLARERATDKVKKGGPDRREQDKQRIEESWPPLKPLPQYMPASEYVKTNLTDTSNPPPRPQIQAPPRVPLESSNQPVSTRSVPNPTQQHKQRRYSEDGHVDQGAELEASASTSSEPISKATDGDVTDPRVVVRRRSLDHRQAKSPPKLRTNPPDPRRSFSPTKILGSERNNSMLDELRDELEASRRESRAYERHIEDLQESYRQQYEELVFEKTRAEKQSGQIRSLKQGKADLETQYANAKKERDNLKRHLGAMTQAYKARGLNYDDFAKVDHLKEEVAQLSAQNAELLTGLSKASDERDRAIAENEDLHVGLDEIKREMEQQHENAQRDFKQMRYDFEVEIETRQQEQHGREQELELQIKRMRAEDSNKLVHMQLQFAEMRDENARLKALQDSAQKEQDAAIEKTLALAGEELKRILQITHSTFEQQNKLWLRAMQTSIAEVNATLATELRDIGKKQQEAQK